MIRLITHDLEVFIQRVLTLPFTYLHLFIWDGRVVQISSERVELRAKHFLLLDFISNTCTKNQQ